MAGNLLARYRPTLSSLCHLMIFLGNYDVSTLYYDGPGDVPGASGGGYGYAIRTEGRTATDPPAS